MIDITYWNTLTNNDKKSLIKTWLDINFNSKLYSENQEIEVTGYLTETTQTTVGFSASLNETCIPNVPGISISCKTCKPPYQGCNHHGGKAGVKACDNVFSYCTPEDSFKVGSVSCTGENGRMLNISSNKTIPDKHTARTFKFIFKKINNTWTIS
jgi:hypothetical protein